MRVHSDRCLVAELYAHIRLSSLRTCKQSRDLNACARGDRKEERGEDNQQQDLGPADRHGCSRSSERKLRGAGESQIETQQHAVGFDVIPERLVALAPIKSWTVGLKLP